MEIHASAMLPSWSLYESPSRYYLVIHHFHPLHSQPPFSSSPPNRSGIDLTSDLAFVLDCTGSMQKYIDATRDHIVGICDMIRGEEGLGSVDDLRVAVSVM